MMSTQHLAMLQIDAYPFIYISTIVTCVLSPYDCNKNSPTKQLEGVQENIVGGDVVETRGNQLMKHVSRHQGQDEAVGQSEGGDREQVNWAGWK